MVVEDMFNVYHEVNVSVVDIGPKSVSCIEKHCKRNENILNAALKYRENEFQGQKKNEWIFNNESLFCFENFVCEVLFSICANRNFEIIMLSNFLITNSICP